MPPFSKTVEEEGVLLDNVKLVEDGKMLEDGMRRLLARRGIPRATPTEHRGPARPGGGQREGRAGVAPHGGALRPGRREGVHGHVQDNAEECVRRVIGVLRNGEFAYEMDNGR